MFLFPTFNSFRLILQEPSNQSPQPRPSSLPEPSITQDENKYRCRRCTQRFPDRRQLYLHGMQEHYQSGGGALQARPWEDGQAPWEVEGTIESRTCTRPTHPSYRRITRKVRYPPATTYRSPTTSPCLN